MTKETYLKRRMTCTRRKQPMGGPIRQSAGSCLSAYALGNAGHKTKSYVQSMTGLPVYHALEECQDCPKGRDLMKQYERRFGPWPAEVRPMAAQKSMILAARKEVNAGEPYTGINLLAANGIPTC